MSSGQEYVVEAILQAKVAQKRKKPISWKYLVKWKDYDNPEDNTWEPAQSFTDGSEHFIHSFWDRANLDGRDRDDVDSFKLNEVIHAIGPPVPKGIKKPRRKSDGDIPVQLANDNAEAQGSEPEVESILEDLSPKRKREGASVHGDSSPSKSRSRTSREAPRKTYTKATRRKSMPAKPKREEVAESAASTSLSNKKKRKFEPSNPSDDEGTVLVPLTKIGPPKGVKRRRGLANDSKPKAFPYQDPGPPSSAATRDQTPPIEQSQSGPAELSIDSLFSSPSIRTAPRSSGIFSSLAVDSASEHGTNSEHGSNKSKTPLPSTVPALHAPSHRVRAANPLVKMMDVPNLGENMKGAISTKAKLTAQTTAVTSKPSSSTRPRLGQLSDSPSEGLLAPASEVQETVGDTVHDVPGPENAVASSSEPLKPLLEVAGLNQAEAEALEDFEDEPMQVETGEQTVTKVINPEETSINKTSSLFNSGRTMSWTTPLGQSSIFGLLGIGSSASNAAPLLQDFFPLNLDSSVSVSVVLKDTNAASSLDLPPLGTIIAQTPRSPPGKFYRPESGAVLLDTLKTGGPSARLVLKEANDEIAVRHFDRFRQRLENGDIFVAMAGPNIMAIVSSENQGVCGKLGIPTVLKGLVSEVVVSAVVIENYSAYADAALLADNHRWL